MNLIGGCSFTCDPSPFASLDGREIKIGFLEDGKLIQLEQGAKITISTDYDIKGNDKMICMSYKKLAYDVKPGSVILCADKTISFTVLYCDNEKGLVQCRFEEGKNVNLPRVRTLQLLVTKKDKDDILTWRVPNKIDMIALSFVRKGFDLVKVENQQRVANFDKILANYDTFMVACDDLGMEIPNEKIFLAKKVMVYKCNIQGKPVVTATRFKDQITKTNLSRSHRCSQHCSRDVSNAVLDDTDCDQITIMFLSMHKSET